MRKLFARLSFFVSFFSLSFSQAPRIQWQRCLGGSGDEEIGLPNFPFAFSSPTNAITVISDNRYILGGQSSSTDGDVNGNHGGYGHLACSFRSVWEVPCGRKVMVGLLMKLWEEYRKQMTMDLFL